MTYPSHLFSFIFHSIIKAYSFHQSDLKLLMQIPHGCLIAEVIAWKHNWFLTETRCFSCWVRSQFSHSIFLTTNPILTLYKHSTIPFSHTFLCISITNMFTLQNATVLITNMFQQLKYNLNCLPFSTPIVLYVAMVTLKVEMAFSHCQQIVRATECTI